VLTYPNITAGVLTSVAQIQQQMAEKVANTPVVKDTSALSSTPLDGPSIGPMVLIKTELSSVKKVQPTDVGRKRGATMISDNELRAAMPADGPIWLPYHDVLDISMYAQEEIDNSHDHVSMFNDFENHFT